MTKRKLICSTAERANRLADKLATHRPGRSFAVYGVRFNHKDGYQVVEVRRFSGFGYDWTEQGWQKQHRPLPVPGPVKPAALARVPELVTVTLPLHAQSKAYVEVLIDGAKACFGRSTLCALEIADGMVTMVLPAKIAAKRGVAA